MTEQKRTELLGTKLTPELSGRVDRLAERMGITRSELAYRAIRNGVDELEGIVSVTESRVGNAASRILAQLLTDPEERDDVLEQLERIRETKAKRHDQQLPYATE